MNRFLVLGICLWWTYCCHVGSLKAQNFHFVNIARAYNSHARWVEPGMLSLSFSCPSVLTDLTGDEILRISPVLTRSDGKRLFFSPVVYITRSAKCYLDRRFQYRSDPFWNNAYFCVGRNEAVSDTLFYQDTLAVGSARGASLEVHYYYIKGEWTRRLASDTLELPTVDSTFILQWLPTSEDISSSMEKKMRLLNVLEE